jgi:pullulanase/glycogen debranching enzyme
VPGFADRSLSVLIDCSEVGEAGDLLVLVNMADANVTYTLPPADSAHPWRLLVDTSARHEDHSNHWVGTEGPLVDGSYEATSWSVAVLANPLVES